MMLRAENKNQKGQKISSKSGLISHAYADNNGQDFILHYISIKAKQLKKPYFMIRKQYALFYNTDN